MLCNSDISFVLVVVKAGLWFLLDKPDSQQERRFFAFYLYWCRLLSVCAVFFIYLTILLPWLTFGIYVQIISKLFYICVATFIQSRSADNIAAHDIYGFSGLLKGPETMCWMVLFDMGVGRSNKNWHIVDLICAFHRTIFWTLDVQFRFRSKCFSFGRKKKYCGVRPRIFNRVNICGFICYGSQDVLNFKSCREVLYLSFFYKYDIMFSFGKRR